MIPKLKKRKTSTPLSNKAPSAASTDDDSQPSCSPSASKADSPLQQVRNQGRRQQHQKHPPVKTQDSTTIDKDAWRSSLQRKVLKLTLKIGKAKTAQKKELLQKKLLKSLSALADQENLVDGAANALHTSTTQPASIKFQCTTSSPSTQPGTRLGVVRVADTPADLVKRAARAERFSTLNAGEADDEDAKLVDSRALGQLWGTSEALEKEYLRLTSLPTAASVRPPEVLSRALQLVKDKWKSTADYRHAWEQLKAIRQDLTVQHVRGALAIDAYETHGRIAIETGDWAEFKQCQSVLQQLYAQHEAPNAAEFAAYSLLNAACHSGAVLQQEMVLLRKDLLSSSAVQHALAVCRAFRAGDYYELLQLYEDAPRMSPYLIDVLLKRMRPWALRVLINAYHPTSLPLDFVAQQLGCDTEEEAAAFSQEQGAVINLQQCTLDTRASRCRAAGPVPL